MRVCVHVCIGTRASVCVSGVRAYLNVCEGCGVFVHACMHANVRKRVRAFERTSLRACLLVNVRCVQVV